MHVDAYVTIAARPVKKFKSCKLHHPLLTIASNDLLGSLSYLSCVTVSLQLPLPVNVDISCRDTNLPTVLPPL